MPGRGIRRLRVLPPEPQAKDDAFVEVLSLLSSRPDQAAARSGPEPEAPIGTIEHAAGYVPYFERHAAHAPLFAPEAAVAGAVIALMRACPFLPEARDNVLRLRAQIERVEHYDGSGWHGFRNAVRAWMDAPGG